MIDVRDLKRSFGGITALAGVSFTVESGERRALIGPNGAGKTTLFNVLTGELAPTSGEVFLAARDVTRSPTHERARLGLARMYQRNELFDPLSARANVTLALGAGASLRPLGRTSRAELAEADELLARVGLERRGKVSARSLSHGERRQLELALALARRPRVLLLDEPTAGMSPAETARITELIAGLDRAITLLIVEHDMDVVFRLADRITVLHEGRVIADGEPAKVRGDRQVNEVYLGKALEA